MRRVAMSGAAGAALSTSWTTFTLGASATSGTEALILPAFLGRLEVQLTGHASTTEVSALLTWDANGAIPLAGDPSAYTRLVGDGPGGKAGGVVYDLGDTAAANRGGIYLHLKVNTGTPTATPVLHWWHEVSL